jgi:hypothetical protein
MIPCEQLSREEKGQSPYATGDFVGHRSIYCGAYVMWLDKMISPQGDPWLLRWNLTATNFLDRDLCPAFLHYIPGLKRNLSQSSQWPAKGRSRVLPAIAASKSAVAELS